METIPKAVEFEIGKSTVIQTPKVGIQRTISVTQNAQFRFDMHHSFSYRTFATYMTDSRRGKMSFKQAIYLALTVLCIYYPITIYFNIPMGHWRNVQFLLFPAIVNFIFYALLIIIWVNGLVTQESTLKVTDISH